MLKKWLAFSLLIPIFSTHAFFDVSPDDLDVHVFEHLRDTKVMNAYPEGTFRPDKIVTRAEGLAIAMRAGGIAILPETKNVFFEDVDPNVWYAPVIRRAIDTKMVALKSKKFRPDDAITKAEYLAFLLRATQVKLDIYTRQTRNIALDVPADSWFAPHFAYAKAFQIAQLPEDQYYRPNKLLSRREVALMTFRQLKLFYGDAGTKTLVELQAQLQQFLIYLRTGQEDKAAVELERISELNYKITRQQSNQDTVATNAIAKALDHFSESLQNMKRKKNLEALESLFLALKQSKKAAEKSTTIAPFATELSALINETVVSLNAPHYEDLALTK